MAAAQFVSLGIQAAKPLIDRSDEIWDKGVERVQKYRRRSMHVYDDQPSSRPRGSRGSAAAAGGAAGGAAGYEYGRNRARAPAGDSYAGYDSEEDYQRRRGRAKSVGSGGRRGGGRYDDRYYDSADDSEGSISPMGRRVQTMPANNQQAMTTGNRGGGNFYSDGDQDSDDSSSVLDSDEDERLERKKRKEEMLTGGIAAVATLHAAANVYGSMKARRAREKALADGSITKEQAKKQRYKHHMQDAASVGLAALSIKGAYGKWQTTQNKHKERVNHREERQERTKKRMEKGISRWNNPTERDAAALRRQLPEAAGNTQVQNGGVVVRPKYNRAYSRSMNDLSRGGGGRYGQPSYGRSARRAGRRYRDEDNDGGGDNDGFDGYDIDNA